MMPETIERFRYRFELWRRELREDLAAEPRAESRSLREYRAKKSAERWSARLSDPKWVLLLTESMWRSVVRSIGVYFEAIIIGALLCGLLVACFPAARLPALILLLVLVSLWTLATIPGEIAFYKARKGFRDGAIKSSNETLQPTANRCDV